MIFTKKRSPYFFSLLWFFQAYASLDHIAYPEAIEKTRLAARAVYNNKDVVAQFSRPLRSQTENPAKAQLLKKGFEEIELTSDIPSYGNIPAGTIYYKMYKEGALEIIIAFHGTESFLDIKTDLMICKQRDSFIGTTPTSSEEPLIKGKFHRGFLTRYQQTRESLFKGMSTLKQKYPDLFTMDKNVFVTGHSMGGALATIAATDLKLNFFKENADIKLIIFCSPKVVNREGSNFINQLLKDNIVRISRLYDPVTALLTLSGYKHVGISMKLKGITNIFSKKNHGLETLCKSLMLKENFRRVGPLAPMLARDHLSTKLHYHMFFLKNKWRRLCSSCRGSKNEETIPLVPDNIN